MRHLGHNYRINVGAPTPLKGVPLWSLADLAEKFGVTSAALRTAIKKHPEFFPEAEAVTHRAPRCPIPRYRLEPFAAGWKRYVESGDARRGPRKRGGQ